MYHDVLAKPKVPCDVILKKGRENRRGKKISIVSEGGKVIPPLFFFPFLK